MLSRTADHLFWMARYMERAENTARMLDVNYQTSLLPQSADRAELGWAGVLGISELTPWFHQKHAEVSAQNVMHFMVRDPDSGAFYATRDGSFDFDSAGYLITNEGMRVQGFTDSTLGTRGDIKIDTTGAPAGKGEP